MFFGCAGGELTLALTEKIMKGERSSRYVEKDFALLEMHQSIVIFSSDLKFNEKMYYLGFQKATMQSVCM